MRIYAGAPLVSGVAIAAAARLETRFGVSQLSSERQRAMGQRLLRGGLDMSDPEQVVLIADSMPPGFLQVPLPGLEIVGVVMQSSVLPLPAPSFPCVGALEDSLVDDAEEGEIVIVDGDRGRVYLSPDAQTLARYQAPLRRARRVFLESVHLPARTLSDGRLVSVLCSVPTRAALAEALQVGADGLALPAANLFLGGPQAQQTASEQAAGLVSLMEAAAGKPVWVFVPPERLAFTALARAAAHGPLHLVLEDLPQQPEIAARLSEIEAALDDDGVQFGTLRYDALVSALPDAPPLPSHLDGFSGVFVPQSLPDADMETLLPLTGVARRAGKPLCLRLPKEGWPELLPTALLLGASRLLVPATMIADVKDAIRTL